MAKTSKMGFEGRLLYGLAGSTAATLLENTRDITLAFVPEKGETTVRGDGTGPVVNASRVVAISQTLTFNMTNKSDDASLAAMLAQMALGEPIALHGEDHSSGKGPDFDYTIETSVGQPYKGEQTIDFTCEPTDEAGRTPVLANLWV